MHASFSLHGLLDANFADLPQVVPAMAPQSSARIYGEVLTAYWQNDVPRLGLLIQAAVSCADAPIHELCAARLEARQNKVTPEALARVEAIAAGAGAYPEIWRAEAAFVLALLCEVSGDDKRAAVFYETAADGYQEQGVFRKAVKSKFNALAAKSRVEPDRRLIYEYHMLHRQALKLGETGAAGTALVNISREYELMGAGRLALKTINKALAILADGAFGTYEYYLSLCRRAQLYFIMGKEELAADDMEEAALSSLPEVQRALAELAARFPHHPRRPAATTKRLDNLESILVQHLAEQPLTFKELQERIYGEENIAYASAENRLKQVLHRVRKKHPSLIDKADGRYYILDR